MTFAHQVVSDDPSMIGDLHEIELLLPFLKNTSFEGLPVFLLYLNVLCGAFLFLILLKRICFVQCAAKKMSMVSWSLEALFVLLLI